MKILSAIAALTLMSSSVSAEEWDVVERCTYSKFFGKMCTTSYREAPARNLAQEQEDEKTRRASIEKWEAFCKPTRTIDNEGVGRLAYAKKGCEFGRSE
jgi:hypothetical protein